MAPQRGASRGPAASAETGPPVGGLTLRLRSAPQFHATPAYGDAVGNDCFELQRLMWHDGVGSELFAEESKPEVRAFVQGELRRGVFVSGLLGVTFLTRYGEAISGRGTYR